MDQNDVPLIVRSALAGMTNGPRHFQRSILHAADLEGSQIGDSEFQLILNAIVDDDPNLEPRMLFERKLHEWDNVDRTTWTNETTPNSLVRRNRIHDCLQYGPEFASAVDNIIPVYDINEPTVIADEHEEWYTTEEKERRNFYWRAYENYLREANRWPESSIRELDSATDRIVARLSDPIRSEAYQTKGLVVGYVQSGKTANFTAVVGKAVDAGYRLIIVLAGTLNILRDQTQRRLDKELIGVELLGGDYDDAPDISEFLAHGARPSELGFCDWHRLTGPEYDYQSLKRGIDSLEFERLDGTKPLYHPTNLYRTKARLVVIKKNGAVIRRLTRDLERLRTKLEDVPALIIDDESDQASINTRMPNARGRTTINQLITDLLTVFPRGQYVGFTATPFANAFISPDDPVDLFPKDYMICLPRPRQYMGLLDFIDQDEDAEGFESNEGCFVRDVRNADTSDDNFQRAIDTFILAGALKLYRQTVDQTLRFRHHTMLVHISRLQDDHSDDAAVLQRIYDNSAFDAPSGIARLTTLWENDFMPVSQRQEPDLPFPPTFAALETHIGECIRRVDSGGRSILIVNGRNDDTPNFSRIPVWKILVGGNKLSRGYTVEGLTVSYYRRTTQAADTLMQMGRWFGFRRGYRDLVRLFIGRDAGTAARPRDLYSDFREVFLMEEEFRADLRKYSEQTTPRVLPRHIPPLVAAFISMPPTSRNKMFNARVVGQNFGGQVSEPTRAPTRADDMRQNLYALHRLLDDNEIHEQRFECEIEESRNNWNHRSANVLTTGVGNDDMLTFLQEYRWLDGGRDVQRQIEFLRGDVIAHGITGWRMIAFQRAQSFGNPLLINDASFNVKSRQRTRTNRFGVYSEPNHISMGQYLAEINPNRSIRQCNETMQSNVNASIGTLFLYPVRENQDDEVSIGFALVFPSNPSAQRLWFSVQDQRNANAVVIPVPS